MIIIRSEAPADRDAIHAVNVLAFGGEAEADLVDALRAGGAHALSLVAVAEEAVVGHLLFSAVTLDSDVNASVKALGLAPLAVVPSRQRTGIGAELVRQGLAECVRAGIDAVFVLGHPAYYPRFGFRPAILQGLRCEWDGKEEAFMALELRPGGLKGRTGMVRYRPEFGVF